MPGAPHLAFWHAATLLREHRGDAHLGVLLAAELDPVEALVSHTATGKGISPTWAIGTRGWSRADWEAAAGRLRERGLLGADGELTSEGVQLRRGIEAETDRLDRGFYERLGAADVERLTELATGFLMPALAAGAFPEGMLGRN